MYESKSDLPFKVISDAQNKNHLTTKRILQGSW